MRLDEFTKNNIIMFLATSVGSFFNFLYQWLMLRAVSKEAFTSLNALISFLIIIMVPAVSFTLMVTKYVSSCNAKCNIEEVKSVWSTLARHAFLFSLAIFGLIVVFSRFIVSFLHLPSMASVIMIGAIFFLSAAAALVTGGLQGLEKFKWLALITVISGFLRLALSLGFIKLMPQLEGALSGFLVSVLFSVLAGFWLLRRLFDWGNRTKVSVKKLYFYILPVAAVSLCFAMLTNLDMILVKHFFIAEAQDYAVAQMVGKVVLFLPAVIYIVMFPRVSSLHALNKSPKKILLRSILFTAILSLSAVAVFNLFPEIILKILAGTYRQQSVLLARLFSLSMLFYALANVLFYYQLSVEKYNFIFNLLTVMAVMFVSLWFFHRSPLWVIATMLAGAVTIFGVNLFSVLR